ncbi:calcium-binding protein, partial [Rhizobiaceae sp. 2RAB30]
VNLTAGVTYTLTAFSKQPYSWVASGPELRLRNAAGTQIAYDNDSGPGLNALITFTASTSGTYYLDVSAFGANFGDDLPGEYSVSVSRQTATNYLMEIAGYYQATAGQRVLGSDGDDEIRGFFVEAYGGNSDDYISADGDVGVAQTISGGPGDDRIYAGQAPATLFGDTGSDFLDGYAWNDRLYGGADADYLYGHQGNDWLDGGTGADRLEGAVGDDTCIVDNSADLALEQSGQGRDTVLASVSYALAFGQEFETLSTTFATGTAAINLTGNEFAQKIDGNNGNNGISGGGGNDTISGYGGNDTLNGGGGNDRLEGGAGNDIYVT